MTLVEIPPTEKPVGRPPGLAEPIGVDEAGTPTWEAQSRPGRFIAAVRAGNYVEISARFAGIPKSTLYWWLGRGRDERDRQALGRRPRASEQRYLDFLTAFDVADAQAEARIVSLWADAAAEDWRAAHQFARTRWPDRWNPPDKIEATGAGGAPLLDPDAIIAAGLARLAQVADRLAVEPADEGDVVDVTPVE